jgi:hypothetical protein
MFEGQGIAMNGRLGPLWLGFAALLRWGPGGLFWSWFPDASFVRYSLGTNGFHPLKLSVFERMFDTWIRSWLAFAR